MITSSHTQRPRVSSEIPDDHGQRTRAHTTKEVALRAGIPQSLRDFVHPSVLPLYTPAWRHAVLGGVRNHRLQQHTSNIVVTEHLVTWRVDKLCHEMQAFLSFNILDSLYILDIVTLISWRSSTSSLAKKVSTSICWTTSNYDLFYRVVLLQEERKLLVNKEKGGEEVFFFMSDMARSSFYRWQGDRVSGDFESYMLPWYGL